jgi:2-polyprenyl-3-methyl-5-hydroxy-6-metoxy-1,4-benzoquinol methylase
MVKAFYDDWYSRRGVLNASAEWLHHRLYNTMVEVADGVVNTRPFILDIGCGPGTALYRLGQVLGSDRLLGVDVSEEALRVARGHLRLERLAVASSDALPLRSSTCGVVTLIEVMEHVPAKRSTLREATRVLTPNGLLLISMPNLLALPWRFIWLMVRLASPKQRARHRDTDQPERKVPFWTLCRWVREDGLKVIKLTGAGHAIPGFGTPYDGRQPGLHGSVGRLLDRLSYYLWWLSPHVILIARKVPPS